MFGLKSKKEKAKELMQKVKNGEIGYRMGYSISGNGYIATKNGQFNCFGWWSYDFQAKAFFIQANGEGCNVSDEYMLDWIIKNWGTYLVGNEKKA